MVKVVVHSISIFPIEINERSAQGYAYRSVCMSACVCVCVCECVLGCPFTIGDNVLIRLCWPLTSKTCKIFKVIHKYEAKLHVERIKRRNVDMSERNASF